MCSIVGILCADPGLKNVKGRAAGSQGQNRGRCSVCRFSIRVGGSRMRQVRLAFPGCQKCQSVHLCMPIQLDFGPQVLVVTIVGRR